MALTVGMHLASLSLSLSLSFAFFFFFFRPYHAVIVD